MAGLFACIAALVALGGILRQVKQPQAALEHQRRVEEDRAWWTRFEWVAGRAVPPDPSDEPLPWTAVLSTFEALASSARDEVQQTAVGAIMDVAATKSSARIVDDKPSDVATNPSATSHALSALRTYVDATAHTPARSTAVKRLLYEAEVHEALVRMFPDNLTIPGGLRAPDALLMFGARYVIVEIKAYSAAPGRQSTARFEAQMRGYLAGSRNSAGLIVPPVAIRLTKEARDAGIHAVEWKSPEDDAELAKAVTYLSTR
ncbi:hypothetical protein [Microbacterium paulum]